MKTDSHEYHAPHCDALVLHRPGTCWACDMFPVRQAERESADVNYTGEYDPAKSLCPAEAFRPVEKINRWYNNTPRTKEQADIDAAEYQKALRKAFVDAGHEYPEEV